MHSSVSSEVNKIEEPAIFWVESVGCLLCAIFPERPVQYIGLEVSSLLVQPHSLFFCTQNDAQRDTGGSLGMLAVRYGHHPDLFWVELNRMPSWYCFLCGTSEMTCARCESSPSSAHVELTIVLAATPPSTVFSSIHKMVRAGG